LTRRALILAVALGLAVLSSLTHRIRKAHAEYADEFESVERYVDMGVVLHVVRRDPAGKIRLGDLPPMTSLRVHQRGGMVDTASDPVLTCGPTVKPAVWYCSEAAEELIVHGADLPSRLLVYGAMGASKTTTLAQWLYFRALEHTGGNVEGGATAPTNERTRLIARAIRDLWPAKWWRWKERDQTFTLANRTTIRLISTHRQSEAEGSRIQGYTWAFAASDEIQDSIIEDENIEARGRGARLGRYPRIATATAKDSPDWRTFRDRIGETGKWAVRHLRGPDSPFVPPQFWIDLQSTLTARAFQRIVEARDVTPEDRVYTSWSRADEAGNPHNLRPVPTIGAVDVTAHELSRFLPGATLLAGHDPGRICDATILLKAYRFPNEREPVWFVVGEVTTERSTTEAHGRALIDFVKKRWGDHRSVLVHIDPHSNGAENDDDRPGKSVTTTLASLGLTVRQAAYQVGSTAPGRIGREERVDMVNTLLCNALGLRRLFVACDAHKQPAAPKLVEAFERLERDAAGKVDRGKKGVGDMTHWPAALGYALWKIEKPRLDVGMRRGG
jgi:hypothetical protein